MQPLSQNVYTTCYADYFLQDCAVVNAHCLAFVLRNLEDSAQHDSLEEALVRKKVLWQTLVHDGEPEARQAAACSVISQSEELFATGGHAGQEAIFVNSHGLVLAPTDDAVRSETRIPESAQIPQDSFFALRAKNIRELVYVCGHDGLVARRHGPNRWQNLSLPAAAFPESPTLLDIDGFTPNDLYAVAMEEGVYHFDGNAWRRVPFPSNILLESVCCGGDGVVYVGGQAGTLFAGRGSRWREVHAGTFILPYADMVWHNKALWCTNDYGVWTFADGVFDRAPVPDEVYFCSGHLSARDGLLLLGGMNGAAVHDGSRWQVLYFQPEIMASLEG